MTSSRLSATSETNEMLTTHARRAVALVAVALAAGCSQVPPGSEAASASGTPTATVTVTASPTPSETAEQIDTCDVSTPPGLVVSTWELVKASKGAPDHVEMVESFFDSASDLSEDYEDAGCKGGAAGSAAMLAYEASLLNATVRVSNPAGARYYESVADAGSDWLAHVDAGREQF